MIKTTTKPLSLRQTILLTGLIAGTLDIISALVVSQLSLANMFHYIASGAIGREAAFSGGIATMMLGFFIHYLIAFSWTILFFVLYPKVKLLQGNKYVIGVLYGALVWVVMNLIILPMTYIGSRPLVFKNILVNMIILMVMIGLPVSLMAHRYYRNNR